MAAKMGSTPSWWSAITSYQRLETSLSWSKEAPSIPSLVGLLPWWHPHWPIFSSCLRLSPCLLLSAVPSIWAVPPYTGNPLACSSVPASPEALVSIHHSTPPTQLSHQVSVIPTIPKFCDCTHRFGSSNLINNLSWHYVSTWKHSSVYQFCDFLLGITVNHLFRPKGLLLDGRQCSRGRHHSDCSS